MKKTITLALAGILAACTLTGCTSPDVKKVEETAYTFMAVVAEDSQEDINDYASTSVVNGDFVKLFDSDALVDQFAEGFSDAELTEETNAKIDEFAKLFSDMIESYSISNIKVDKDGNATAVATIKTSFPIEVVKSEAMTAKITGSVSKYYTDNSEEINALMAEDETSANNKIYNDIIQIVLNLYEDEIAGSSPMIYGVSLELQKNPVKDTWMVTDVKDLESN